jgi:hypothetical protein
MSRLPKNLELRLIRDLLRQKSRYELYFSSSEALDHQALNAYVGIIKATMELLRKAEPQRLSPQEGKKLLAEILRTEYGLDGAL